MRRLSLSLYLLIAVAELVHWAIVPLLPALAARFGLSELETGALVASTGLATLAVSLPAGMLADRFGARRLTLWAAAALAATTLAQALAPSYALLLLARLLFGLGFGVVWTAGLAWLSSVSPERSDAAMGATVTSAGVGTVVAPGFAGVLADALGLAAPFVAAAAMAAAVAVALVTAPAGRADAAPPERTTLSAVSAATREPRVGTALAAVLLAGLAGGMISVVGPLELHGAGLSGASIGAAFSAAALVFIAASALTVWLGSRLVGVVPMLAACAAFTIALSPLTLSGASASVIAAMCLSAPLRAVLYTTAYPLGAAGAPDSGAGAGSVMGLLNAAWALTTVVGPLAGGALAASLGPRETYALLQVLAVLTVGALALRARRLAPC